MNTTKLFITRLHQAMDRVAEVNEVVDYNPGSRYSFIYNLLTDLAFNLNRVETGDSPYEDHYIDAIIAVDYFMNLSSSDDTLNWVRHYENLREYNKEVIRVVESN